MTRLAVEHPFMQAASGVAFDLVAPTPSMVSFDDIAEHLSKIARFAGATPGRFYSVAEHCVRAAYAVEASGAAPNDVAAVLLHDAHEAYIVDRITPERWAEEVIARDSFGAAGLEAIRNVPKLLRYRIDAAIHEAAGLTWPLPVETQQYIKRIDLRMLATERRDLMRPTDDHWPLLDGIESLPERIAPWAWGEAWRMFGEAAKRFVPALKVSA